MKELFELAPVEKSEPQFTVTEHFVFEAAHFIPGASKPELSRLHGHTHEVWVTIRGAMQRPFGWVVESSIFRSLVEDEIKALDHCCLNDVMNPTTGEAVCLYLWDRLRGKLGGRLHEIRLGKALGMSVSYKGECE